MTTIVNQVTCSPGNMKFDELKWEEHLVSTNHLYLCKNVKAEITIKFFEMISNTCPKKSEIYIVKIKKTHDFWQLHTSKKLSKEILVFCAAIESIIQN